jgi:hypothetical protein
MSIFDWIISLVAFCWLTVLAIMDRQKKKINPLWTGIPLMIALAVRMLTGIVSLMSVTAIMIFLISERRHLKHRGLEALVLLAGLFVIVFLLFVSDIDTQVGMAGLIIFWFAWELHFIDGLNAMILMTCILVWPQENFLIAYLASGLLWSLVIRFREGSWLKGHSLPMPLVLLLSVILFLGYSLLLLLKVI